MKKLKAAVFGTGFVGRVHVEGIRRLGNVEVYAIGVGPDDDAARLGAELACGQSQSGLSQAAPRPGHRCGARVHSQCTALSHRESGAGSGQTRGMREAAGDVGGRGA